MRKDRGRRDRQNRLRATYDIYLSIFQETFPRGKLKKILVARVEPALPGLPAPSITGQNTRTTIILYFFNCSLLRITRSNDHFFSLSISIRQVTKIHTIRPLFSFLLPIFLLQTFIPRSFLSMHRGTEKHSYIVCNGCNDF